MISENDNDNTEHPEQSEETDSAPSSPNSEGDAADSPSPGLDEGTLRELMAAEAGESCELLKEEALSDSDPLMDDTPLVQLDANQQIVVPVEEPPLSTEIVNEPDKEASTQSGSDQVTAQEAFSQSTTDDSEVEVNATPPAGQEEAVEAEADQGMTQEELDKLIAGASTTESDATPHAEQDEVVEENIDQGMTQEELDKLIAGASETEANTTPPPDQEEAVDAEAD